MQKIGSLAYPISFLSLVMGTITWHFHIREVVLENLPITQKAKAGPFFLIIVIQKSWVMADLCSTMTMIVLENTDIHWLVYLAKALPLFLVITCEMVLHLAMPFPLKTATLGSIANITTLWRPTHDESQNDKCRRFYKHETILSSLLYLIFSLLSLTLNYTLGKQEENWFWPHILSVGLSCVSLLLSQLCLVYCPEALFPRDIEVDPAICKDILTMRTEPLLEVSNQAQTDSDNSKRQEQEGKASENTEITIANTNRQEQEGQACEKTDASSTRESIQMRKLPPVRAIRECNNKMKSDLATQDVIEGEEIVPDHTFVKRQDESNFDTKEDEKSVTECSKCSRLKLWFVKKSQSLVKKLHNTLVSVSRLKLCFVKKSQSLVRKLHNVMVSVWKLLREEKTWIWVTLALSLMFVVGAPGYHYYNMEGKLLAILLLHKLIL